MVYDEIGIMDLAFANNAKWSVILAYCLMAIGILSSLTIVGALYGVPIFLSGMNLKQGSEGLLEFYETNEEDGLVYALEKQKTYFMITAIMTVLSLASIVISVLGSFSMIMAIFSGGMSESSN